MYTRILVPTDGSPCSERGLREAIALARQLKASLVLLHVVNDFPLLMAMGSAQAVDVPHAGVLEAARATLTQAEAAAAAAGVDAECVLRDARTTPVADVVVEEARTRRCDLIVMGTHGRRGLRRLTMGSDAELVLRHAPVPVLLVRDAETASPAAQDSA
ncbi:universal stress protein [Aquabacterium humicola]|uniref:universal stress protein n=1 Tax=Aquabacterium humicola TaxID=3237377 RepID=UPI002543D33F|nr:universal stress protein [Rubrivivax pictus]